MTLNNNIDPSHCLSMRLNDGKGPSRAFSTRLNSGLPKGTKSFPNLKDRLEQQNIREMNVDPDDQQFIIFLKIGIRRDCNEWSPHRSLGNIKFFKKSGITLSAFLLTEVQLPCWICLKTWINGAWQMKFRTNGSTYNIITTLTLS